MVLVQQIQKYAKLGVKLFLSPKANAAKNGPGFQIGFPDKESVSVTITIGKKGHQAILCMDIDAYQELISGEQINIMTCKEFKKNKF